LDKVVIFDMDGTLLNSSKDITISINHVRETLNLPPLEIDYVVKAINSDQKNLAYLFYEQESYLLQTKALFQEHYFEQCTKNVYLYNGIEGGLKQLYKDRFKLAVATNASTKFAVKMLEHLGVYNLFESIVGANRVENPKPNPEMLYKILDKYNYNKAWIVGDHEKDLYAGKNAGIESLHVHWGFGNKHQLFKSFDQPKNLFSFIQNQ